MGQGAGTSDRDAQQQTIVVSDITINATMLTSPGPSQAALVDGRTPSLSLESVCLDDLLSFKKKFIN